VTVRILSTLRTRIFVAASLLALLPIGLTLQFLSARATGEIEAQLRRGLREAAALVQQHHADRGRILLERARLVADLPRLKAALATADPPTIDPLARDYRERVKADVFALTDRRGKRLAVLGDLSLESPAVEGALSGMETASVQAGSAALFEVVTVPVTMEDPLEVLGSLTLGSALDDAMAARFKALTGSDVAFAYQGSVRASSLPRTSDAGLEPVLRSEGVVGLRLGADEYVAVHEPLGTGGDAPQVLVLRSRSESVRFLSTLRTALLFAAAVGVAVAVLLSYAVARSVTRPLAVITDTMREVAATGDLARKIDLSGSGSDEDTRLLAGTFNSLTDSIARFQREGALRDRLSALGRLSTVVAHEVRNPLMIIKASLRSLRRDALPEAREALDDIDHEVERLDRTVGDVLDFARPLRLDCAPADLNAICREAVQATRASGESPEISLALDDALPPVITDAERLRTVLVNVLANARDSVREKNAEVPVDGGGPPIELRTFGSGATRAAVVVEDRGTGIAAEDLAHVFEPYFTTKRTGTGLGLAIAKNIVESLGGAVSAESRVGVGTSIRLDLPVGGPGGRV
jgi:signal transduction histidine kinase